MKTITIFLIITLLLLAMCGNSQVSGQMRIGYAFDTGEPIIAPAVSLEAYGLALSSEMIIYTRDDMPVSFGSKLSYQYKFIQAGAGYYYNIYSLDKGFKSYDGRAGMLFVSAHYDRFFLEYDYKNQSVLSFGMKETIF